MSKAHINIREEIAEFRKKSLTEGLSTSIGNLKDLEKIIEEQSKELTLRTKTIEALQRNFESLSDFCKSEKLRSQHLSRQVEDLTKENERLQVRLKELALAKSEPKDKEKSESKGARNDLETLKEMNNSLQKAIQAKAGEIEKLEDNLRKVKIERERMNKEVTTLKDKLASKDKHIKELEREVSSLKGKLSEAVNKAQQKDKLVEDLISEREMLKEKVNQLTQTLKIKETVINGLQKKVGEGAELIEKLKAELAGLETSKHYGGVELNQYKEEQVTLKKKIEELELKLSSTTGKLAEVTQNYQDGASKNEELKLEVNRLKENEGKLKEEITGKEKENEYLRETIKNLNDQVNKLQKSNEKLEEEKKALENSNACLVQLQAKFAKLSEAVKESIGRAEAFKTELEKMKSETIQNASYTEDLIRSKNETISQLRKELDAATGSSANLTKELNEKLLLVESMLSEMRTKLAETEKKLAEAEGKFKVLDNENSILRDQLMSKSEDSAETLTRLNKSLIEAKAALESKQKELILVKEKKKSMENEVTKLKQIIEQKDKLLENSMYENASLNSRLGNLNEILASDKRTMEELNGLIEKYKAEAKSMGDELAKLTGQLAKYTEMEAKAKIVAAKEAKIKDVISRVESVYESFQCNLTCLLCGEVSQKCTLCIPCGHCFCERCIVGKHKSCPNCSGRIQDTFACKVLEEIACKFAYSKKMIDVFKDDACWGF